MTSNTRRSPLATISIRPRRALHLAALLAALTALQSTHLSTAHAANWTNAGGGTFNVGSNWSTNPTVPGASDIATFNLNNTYTVNFNNSPSNLGLSISSGNVTFLTDGNPRTYTLGANGGTLSNATLTLGVAAAPLTLSGGGAFGFNVNAGGTFNILSGNQASLSFLGIGQVNAGTATVLVDAASLSAQLAMGKNAGNGNLTFQNGATGSFTLMSLTSSSIANSASHVTIQSNSHVTSSGNLDLGTGSVSGQLSTFLITGTGSSFTQTGATTFTAGASANSLTTLTIQTGGTFTTGTGLSTLNATATVNLNGGTYNANGDTLLNGGKIIEAGGTFNLAAGKNLTAQNNATFSFADSYNIANGSTFSISTGSHFSTTSFVNVGNGSNGTLIVDGTSSTFSSALEPYWGAGGGTGTVTFRNGASATITNVIEIAQGANSGTIGNVTVQSGASLSASDIFIADGGGATGALTLSDPTSSVTVTSGLLSIGNVIAGQGTLNVNGGTFTASGFNITIYKTGTLNINGGAFNANTDIIVTGGTLQRGVSGAFNLAAGKNLTAQNGATVSFTGANAIGNGSTYTVITGGHLSSTDFFDVGNGSTGTLIVDGTSSTFSATGVPFWGASGGSGTVTFRNGASATVPNGFEIAEDTNPATSGNVTVQTGASLATDDIDIESQGGGTGVLTLSDPTSSILQNSGRLQIGHTATGSGTLNINGGTFTASTGGITINKTGTLNLNGGTFNANSDITVTGGALHFTDGAFNLANGKQFTAQSGANVDFIGYSLANNNTFTIQAAAHFTANSFLDIGDGGSGALNVSDPGTQLTIADASTWGQHGGFATVIFANHAAITLNSSLTLNRDNNPASTASLDVSGFATFTVGTLNIGAAGGGTATIQLKGAGASITQIGNSNLTIGNGSSGLAMLNIALGAVFKSGTGLTTVNRNGNLDINAGGTFNANGNLRFNPGANLQFGGTTNAWTSSLNLNSSRAVVETSTPTDKASKIALLNNLIASARGTASTWTGAGITSSTVAANPIHLTLGLYDNAALHDPSNPALPRTTWAGQPVDSTSLLITPALKGDANLDGIVDIADMVVIANNWNTHGLQNGTSTIDMAHGDVNQDGIVDIADMVVIANNWNQTSSFNLTADLTDPAFIASLTSNVSTPAPVPEPAALGLLLVAIPLLRKRRSRMARSQHGTSLTRSSSPTAGTKPISTSPPLMAQ